MITTDDTGTVLWVLFGDSNAVGFGSALGGGAVPIWDGAAFSTVNIGGIEQELHPRLVTTFPSATHRWVKVASGGQTADGQFKPGSGALHAQLITEINAALAAIAGDKQVGAYVCSLGVNDAQSSGPANAYEQNMADIHDTLPQNTVPAYVMEPSQTAEAARAFMAPIRAATLPDYVILPSDAWDVTGDNIHFSAAGYTQQAVDVTAAILIAASPVAVSASDSPVAPQGGPGLSLVHL